MAIRRAAAERRGASTTPEEAPGGIGPEAVRVCLLGGFRVRVGERAVGSGGWRLKKAASLVKILALSKDHRLHREQAMDLLWPELDVTAATNNLRQALHVARKTLQPTGASGYLRLRGEQVSLCPDSPLWVDAGAFEQAAATAKRTRDPAAYRAAIELYAGDLLPEDRYEPWAEDSRAGLRNTYLSLLVRLAALHRERGEFRAAAEALDKAITVEPFHEEAHAALMSLYAGDGRRNLALRQYERLAQRRAREGLEPGAAVRLLHEQVKSGRLPTARPAPAGDRRGETAADDGLHNLPAPRSSLVGRERDTVEVKRALAMTCLLTLTGTGGSGKTRLALAVARDVAGAYEDGSRLVELASLSNERLVAQEVAGVLGVSERANRPISAALVDALRGKQLLLVLDNCEHVVNATARLVEALIVACPRLRILATSREPLGVAGEASWPVPPLSAPGAGPAPTVEELAGYGSARLFVERARSHSPAFEVTPENAGAVAEICRKLDGVPLAVELAAARVGTLSAAQISIRLSNSLNLLTGGGRTAQPRQRTIRGALDWSHELLTEDEKRLFARLSVFAGGWTLEAAEAVSEGDALDPLSRLVDKSLVVVEVPRGTQTAPRYRLLEPVRQYAREKLEAAQIPEKADATRRRHAECYLALAERAEPELLGARQTKWLERLEVEHDNLRAALSWFFERGEAEANLRLAGALGEFWRVRGYLREGLWWLEAALGAGPPTPARVNALVHAGWISWECLDFERAAAFSEEALALSRELGDKAGAAAALYHLGMVEIYARMRAKEAWRLFEESLALRRELGDEVGIGRTLQKMGLLLVVGQDFERAAKLYGESLALARRAEDKLGIVMALWLGALASLGFGDHRQVEKLCEEGLGLAVQLKHTHAVTFMLNVLAASAGAQDRPSRSARLWGASEALLDSMSLALGPAERYHFRSYVVAARESLGDAAWEAAKHEGRAMSLEKALEYALSREEPGPPEGATPESTATDGLLTRHQREVAAMIARGLSNQRIAAELTLSERTVETHVHNILKRLGLGSRTQLAAWVREQRPAR
jgi:predicted ATPase/DNA-binding SARP family transcriptional activator/DNA-binding CsgD family transcriptional regulator